MVISVNQWRRLSCCATSSVGSRLIPNPPDLIGWIRQEGGFVHPSIRVTINGSSSNNGGCLIASEDIPKGSNLIILPPHIPLKFQSQDSFINLLQHVPDELWAMKLGLTLLQERAKRGSFWWPYIANLPPTFTVPIFFHGEDIKNLQYAPLLHQVNKRCRFLLDFEKIMKKELEHVKLDDHPFGGHEIDASSLGWAMSAVSSRAFRLHGLKGQDGIHANVPMLLPLIDMCNHNFSPNVEIVQEHGASEDNMLVKAVADGMIKQDDELELNYGCLNSDFFLLDYGFVMPSNPYDYIELRYDSALLETASMTAGVSSPSFSAPLPWQKQILLRLNLDGENSDLKWWRGGALCQLPRNGKCLPFASESHFQHGHVSCNLTADKLISFVLNTYKLLVSLGGSDIIDGRLLAALRVLLSNEKEEVEKQDINTLKSMTSHAPLGTEVETSALRTIITLCLIALQHFPTKIMEDESLLKQKVSNTTELAIRYRIQKKSVIIDALRDLTLKLRLLSSK